jgi:hypothetical protein
MSDASCFSLVNDETQKNVNRTKENKRDKAKKKKKKDDKITCWYLGIARQVYPASVASP